MSLSSQVANLTKGAAKMRQGMFPDTIIITDFSGNKRSFTAAVAEGPSAFEGIAGGGYETTQMTAELMIVDLAGFVPKPDMLVTARSKSLRIAPDGVTPGKTVFRLRLISATAPSSR